MIADHVLCFVVLVGFAVSICGILLYFPPLLPYYSFLFANCLLMRKHVTVSALQWEPFMFDLLPHQYFIIIEEFNVLREGSL